MSKGRTRHMFAGGNTSEGFFSYFDHILPQEWAERIYILKGGPGTGKSTFMKNIAEALCNEGYETEFIHCSSDPSSLDAVVFPEKGISIMDGTAPHVVDPKNPGAVDEIINLGRFWNNEGLTVNREGICAVNAEIGELFRRAYRYLQAGYSLYRDNEVIYGMAMDRGKANAVISGIIKEIFAGIDIAEKEGKQRHMFASAITPDGLVNYLPSLLTTKKVVVIEGKPGTGTEKLLEKARNCATERGLYTESYYCALNPHKLEHLVIPELDISLTTSNESHHADVKYTEKIDLNKLLDDSVIRRYKEEIEFNGNYFKMLLNRAVETIKKAREKHDELEKFYIPNMNFDEIKKCQDELLDRIAKN